MLKDSFGRIHDYLRISLTDKCNFACAYCRPGKYCFLPENELMTPREIEKLAENFVALGVKKIRLTGGEPLLRKDFPEIIKKLTGKAEILTLTTNGFYTDKFISHFREAGINSINVSLDSLKPERFKRITRFDGFNKVYSNILQLTNEGFHLKLNMVVMRGINDDELVDFIELTRNFPLHIRFIELMPFGGNNWKKNRVVSYMEMLREIEKTFEIIKLPDEPNETARKYFVPGFRGSFAFISTITDSFCGTCNRLRITSDGKLKNCLFSKNEVDLLKLIRNKEDIKQAIYEAVFNKNYANGGLDISEEKENIRSMISVGG